MHLSQRPRYKSGGIAVGGTAPSSGSVSSLDMPSHCPLNVLFF